MQNIGNSPVVSVVLPAYKGEFFRQAIQGILSQTYRDFRLIVVDDASPFDLLSVLKEFNDDRVSYYRNAANIGGKDLASAFCVAYAHANGKYVVLASDDDVYLPTYLEEMVELAEAHPDCSLFSCRVGHIDDCGKIKSPGVPVLDHETTPYFIWMHEVNRRHLTMPEWFIRKSSLDAIGGIARYPLLWFSDTQTMYQLASYGNGGVRYSQKMLVLYRDSNGQMSNPSRCVIRKTEATIAFYKWFARFIDELRERSPVSCAESAMLEKIKDEIPRRARTFLLQLGRHVNGVCSLLRYIRRATASPYVKIIDIIWVLATRYLLIISRVFHAN